MTESADRAVTTELQRVTQVVAARPTSVAVRPPGRGGGTGNAQRAAMNVVWAILIIAAVAAVAVTALLLVRRRAPEGGYFEDGDRAAGVFGVLATGFSVLLGFIVFLAFESYDQSRSGAEQEALVLVQQVENAQFFPQPAGGELTGQLVCYGRSVVNDEWDRMRAGTQGDAINPWGVTLFRTLQTVQPRTATQQSAYDKWLDQTSTREEARRDRIHGAVGVIPTTLWIVLFFIAARDLRVHALLRRPRRARGRAGHADRVGRLGDGRTVLLLNALDDPFHGGVGGLQPVAMERSLRIIDEALGAIGDEGAAPVRRAREAGAVVTAAGARSRPGGARRDRAARARHRRDGVERLPVDQVERRAGEGGSARERAADRVGQGGGPREHPDGDRRGDLHAVGQRLRPEADRSWRTSTSSASARSSSLPSTRGSRPGRSRTRTRR